MIVPLTLVRMALLARMDLKTSHAHAPQDTQDLHVEQVRIVYLLLNYLKPCIIQALNCLDIALVTVRSS